MTRRKQEHALDRYVGALSTDEITEGINVWPMFCITMLTIVNVIDRAASDR